MANAMARPYQDGALLLGEDKERRDVAQLGSALPWGGRGRQFKSDRSDQMKENPPLGGYYYITLKYLRLFSSPC